MTTNRPEGTARMHGIADYEFVRPLGSGNNGRYFLARRPARLPVGVEHVAVKVLAAESTDVAFRRAVRELTAFGAVRSPYLVAPWDAGQQDGSFFYAMEYFPAGSLADPASPVEPGAALRAVADAARAVAGLHAAGIVHRDLKPGNVLLHPAGGRLSDLGLAQVFAEGVTITGMGSLDSVEYIDPAVLLGGRAGPSADVWSLGVLLHRVAAGTGVHGPLPDRDGLLALRRVLAVPPQISERLGEPLAGLVRDCLGPAGERPAAATVAARIDGLA